MVVLVLLWYNFCMKESWKTTKGKNLILFIAQHNFPQLRENKLKPVDLLTGVMAENLTKKFNCFSMITTKIELDPNWYEDSPFRKEVFKIIKEYNIKLVVDIHGRKINSINKREIFLNKSFIRDFSVNLKEDWAKMDFKDNNQLTLSEDLDKLDIPAIELELRLDIRQAISNRNDNSIEELISQLNKGI